MIKNQLLKLILYEILMLERPLQPPQPDFSAMGKSNPGSGDIDPQFLKGFVPGSSADDDYKTVVGKKAAPTAKPGQTIPQMNMNTMQQVLAPNAQLDNRSQQAQAFTLGANNLRLAIGKKTSGKVTIDFSNPQKITVSDH